MVMELAEEYGVEMPIVDAVDALVQGTITPTDLVKAMIARQTQPEVR